MKKNVIVGVVVLILIIVGIALVLREDSDYAGDFKNGPYLAQKEVSLSDQERGVLLDRLSDLRIQIESAQTSRPYRLVSLVFVELGEYEQARLTLAETKDKFPEDAEVTEALGDVLVLMRQYKDAARTWEAAIELDPKNPETYLKLASLYLAQSVTPLRAQAIYERALISTGEQPKVLLNYASFLEVRIKDIPGAISMWERTLEATDSEGQRESIKIKIEELRKKIS